MNIQTTEFKATRIDSPVFQKMEWKNGFTCNSLDEIMTNTNDITALTSIRSVHATILAESGHA
jgi:hypothetical protein